ncbi:hypothetical protein CGRA01v4_13583 [Colletotrichum graminicola]|nr:hypothetical protein CGRA01v4_13583 [Colletotrichum graminicola]
MRNMRKWLVEFHTHASSSISTQVKPPF